MVTRAFMNTCRKCKRTLPINDFKTKRKSCNACLYGEPVDARPIVVSKSVRKSRRWWPHDVVAHVPTWQKTKNCLACWTSFEATWPNQIFCCSDCRKAGRSLKIEDNDV